MKLPKRLLLASHNSGKLREIKELISPYGIEACSASELDLPEPDETEETFEGNARIKAHAAARASGMVALADDSGIVVDALGGEPGVHTADWAETGSGRDFVMAMTKVWDRLEEIDAPEPRLARFVSVLCLASPDGTDHIFRGEAPGRLVWPMRGKNGFGFDPMFVPEGHEQTYGEMDPALKHSISHRAASFSAFKKDFLQSDA